MQQALQQQAGARFNPRRQHDVANFLFNRCKISPVLRNQQGPRCDSDALRALANHNEQINLILDERSLFYFCEQSGIDAISPACDESGFFSLEAGYSRSMSASGSLKIDQPLLRHMPDHKHNGRQLRRAIPARAHSIN